jgi:DNA-binding IclR family transcriptional regulator
VLNSAANALRALEHLVECEEAGVSEIARHLGVTVGTGHRILVTLVETGFAEQNPDTRRYRPSGKVLSLAQKMRSGVDVRDRVHLHLVELMQEVRESVHLGVLDGGAVRYVDKVPSDQPFSVEFKVGSRLPAHCTALGRALLAFDDDADIAASLKVDSLRTHDIAAPSRQKLTKALRIVRSDGVAEDGGEFLPDIRCVAAPIRGASGSVIAAIDIAAPRSRFERERVRLRGEVQRSADRISEQLRLLGANAVA